MRTRTGVLLASATAAAVFLSGCGSGGDSTETVNGQRLTKLSVGYTSEGGLQIPAYIGDEMGIFKKHGLDVKLVKLNSSSSLIPAISSGSVNIGTGDGSALCSGVLTGTGLKIVGANLSTFTLEAWGPSSIQNFADLKGKTVGVTAPGSTSDFALEAALKANSLQRSDVKVVYLHSLPATVAAVESGAVQATLVVPPYGDTLQPKGFHRIYDTSKLQHVSTAFAASTSYAKSHGDAIRKFDAAMAEAVQLASDPAQESKVVPILSRRATVSAADAKYTFDYFQPLWTKGLSVDPTNWTSTCQEAARTSKAKPGVVAASALDMSYLSN